MAGEFYIAPNTEIRLMKNVPLDPTYEHTIHFANATEQYNHFSSDIAYPFHRHATNLTYQRIPITGVGTIRLGFSTQTGYENLYGYNYMMFNNHSFENKWFYAFILDIRYINNNAYEVDFQLDQMQTWQFDYTLQPSFVEREHADTDVEGDNLIPENLELGDYTYRMVSRDALIDTGLSNPDGENWVIGVFSTIKTVYDGAYTWEYRVYANWRVYEAKIKYKINGVWSTETETVDFLQTDGFAKWKSSGYYRVVHSNWEDCKLDTISYKKKFAGQAYYYTSEPSYILTNKNVEGKLVNGVYSGLNVIFFSSTADCNEWIYEATRQDMAEGIVSVVMIPAFCAMDIQGQENTKYSAKVVIDKTTTDNPIKHFVNFLDNNRTKSYSTIHNKKLFTSPFMTMLVVAHDGNIAEYPYEYFQDPQNIVFHLRGNVSCNPTLALVPVNYRGTTDENKHDTMYAGNLPQCAYNIDSYQAWLAQNRYQLGLDYASGAIKTIASVATMGVGLSTAYVGGVIGESAMKQAGQAQMKQGAGELSQTGMGIARTLATQYEHSLRPPYAKGSNTGSLSIPLNAVGFQIYCASIRPEYAERIDNYFSMYGYATKAVKVPNTCVRKRWTYTKTIGANVFPSNGVPASALEEIKAIYDNGITFWRYYNGFDVGNYNFSDNDII